MEDQKLNLFLQDLTGDVNSDLSVDVIDVVLLIEFILNSIDVNDENYVGDLNGDNIFTVLDIVILIDIILNN